MVGVSLLGVETKTHTYIRVGSRESSEESLRGPTQVCNKITEQTYPDLILVNIKLIYSHRDWITISPPYE